MCMGPPLILLLFCLEPWVYPHVYGATEDNSDETPPWWGLSPCVWGHPLTTSSNTSAEGSIPMCMGPPSPPGYYSMPLRVYPHVYGATYPSSSGMSSSRGLSPCVWGHLLLPYHLTVKIGSIPMCMGPPNQPELKLIQQWVYPHVYGGTWVVLSVCSLCTGLSPCVWGHLLLPYHLTVKIGSIPMCMGPPNQPELKLMQQWVYPHVYGATCVVLSVCSLFTGLSPCVWGHPVLVVYGGVTPFSWTVFGLCF